MSLLGRGIIYFSGGDISFSRGGIISHRGYHYWYGGNIFPRGVSGFSWEMPFFIGRYPFPLGIVIPRLVLYVIVM